MSDSNQGWNDEQIEQMVGNLLRTGVLVAAAVVLLGGVVFLAQHGAVVGDYRVFHGEPKDLRNPEEIARDVFRGSGRAMIQLGLLLLIATPVARVVFSAFAFWRQRDWMYLIFTLTVLAVLLYSLIRG